MSDEQVWYLYQNEKQIGPFDTQQVLQLITNKMISQDSYIFKVGWKDWRPIEEGYEELGVDPAIAKPIDQVSLQKKRDKAPRASISGRVVVHNNNQLAIGKGVNISATGIFIETAENLFTVGEHLKLSVRCDGINKAFNAIAKVIRFNTDDRYPIGYGLSFENLEEEIKSEISNLVGKQENKKRSANSKD
ncbi:MAG: PilZ domain-containing protein [Oligoflexales bacterium]|nr:PilZ domain-containing protein [Oligoflexales bacterium]